MQEKYQIGKLTLTRKKLTYGNEARAKESAGINEADEELLSAFTKQIKEIQSKIEKSASDDERLSHITTFQEVAEKLQALREKIDWSTDFDRAKKVLSALVNEDVETLTDEDFGKWDVMEVWDDFFTRPRNSDKNQN